MSDSTNAPGGRKSTPRTPRPEPPKKPHPDFPLYAHRVGRWAKKVLSRTVYFTDWREDPKGVAALEMWLEQKDDLLAGREPGRNREESLTVAELCNRFLATKEQLRGSGELSPRTFLTYHGTCGDVVKCFGRQRLVADLTPDDFRSLRTELARRRRLVALRNAMVRVLSIFKFAFDDGLIDKPVRTGVGFKLPKQSRIDSEREASRAEHGLVMFEAAEIRAILDEAKPPLRTMVLLAANCGFGQTDLANLPTRALNLETGWAVFGRGKTGVARRIPLWPETIDAVRDWLKVRPKAKEQADSALLFLTRFGRRFLRLNEKGHHIDGIGQEFQKLIGRLGLKRPRLGVYALRHTFETVAGDTRDQVAVDAIMGHRDRSMASHYRERISDDRLRRVVEAVRAWLFTTETEGPGGGSKLNREICGPSDPAALSLENEGKTGVANQNCVRPACDPGATPTDPPAEGGEPRVANSGPPENFATLKSTVKNSVRVDGPQGPQNVASSFSDRPQLRVFAG